MNCQSEGKPYCYFHPKEILVGICAPCLNERLLILASEQRHLPLPKNTRKSFRSLNKVFAFGSSRKSFRSLDKVFALGSLLDRLEFRRQKPNDDDPSKDSGGSLEDSFISIQFEDNGIAMLDSNRACNLKPIMEQVKEGNWGKSVVEHTKPLKTLKWRKRIGHLLQLARWKRSRKSGVCDVSSAAKSERKKGWIRSLTMRRTTITTTTTTTTIND